MKKSRKFYKKMLINKINQFILPCTQKNAMKRLTTNVKPSLTSTLPINSIKTPISPGHSQRMVTSPGHSQRAAINLRRAVPRSSKSTVTSPDHSQMTRKRTRHSIKLKLSQMGRSSRRERMGREHPSLIVDRSKRSPTSSSS